MSARRVMEGDRATGMARDPIHAMILSADRCPRGVKAYTVTRAIGGHRFNVEAATADEAFALIPGALTVQAMEVP